MKTTIIIYIIQIINHNINYISSILQPHILIKINATIKYTIHITDFKF